LTGREGIPEAGWRFYWKEEGDQQEQDEGLQVLQGYWSWVQDPKVGDRGKLRRQEVPFHRQRFYPWPHSYGRGGIKQNEEHYCASPGLLALRKEVQAVGHRLISQSTLP
jgi:hypothetical protein